jgi:hypothetical protein
MTRPEYEFCIHCGQTCYLNPGQGNCCGACLERFTGEGSRMADCPCCGSHVPDDELTRCAWCLDDVCDHCIADLHSDDPDCEDPND